MNSLLILKLLLAVLNIHGEQKIQLNFKWSLYQCQ